MTGPLVSCLMPTYDRRRFVPLAVEYFLRQDYEQKELVVLDDGTDPVADLMPPDPRVRYVRLDRRTTLGTKRNLACEEARGEVLVHWDDDDWSAPHRLTYQVGALVDRDAEACGLRRLLFYDPARDRGWRYEYPPADRRPWVAGGTLCYRRELWRRHRFPDLRHGEDTRFLWAARPRRLAALEDERIYVAIVHRANTSRKNTASRRWRDLPGRELRAVLGADAGRYGPSGPRPMPAIAPAAEPPPAPEPHVTVSIPYHGCPGHVAQAVESILAQTHRNLTVVVVNDADDPPPWPALAHLDDPRLVRFDLDTNQGRYFADEVVLRATTSPWFLIQDADDWSEPDRIARLLAAAEAEEADAAISFSVFHDARRRGRSRVMRWRKLREPMGADLVHRADFHGLYRTEAVRRIGGWYAGFRIGYDTAILNFLIMTGRIARVDRPLYHRRLRPGSLTSSPATGHGSPARRAVAGDLRQLHAEAFRAYRTSDDRAAVATAIERLVGERRPTGAALDASAERLRTALADVARPRPVVVAAPRAPDVYDLVRRDGVPWGAWVFGKSAAIEVTEHLRRRRPRRILEAGSGTSTLVLAAHAAADGAEVVSLEHDVEYHRRTARLLERHGLRGAVDLRLAPLRPRRWPGGTFPWYDTTLAGRFDFFMVDGPPEKHGREGALFAYAAHRSRNWEAWLFDGRRAHERRCLQLWQRHFRFDAQLVPLDESGVWVIRPRRRAAGDATEPPPAGLGIAILTGDRLPLLRSTLDAFQLAWPKLLDASYVMMLINGPDRATLEHAGGLDFVDDLVAYPNGVLTIGAATSYLMAAMLGRPGVSHVLNLQDDWEACSLDAAGLRRAQEVLDGDPGIGQVRLRHRSDAVLGRHMVTGRPMAWREADGYLDAVAHFTLNPSLVREADLPKIFPAQSEADAQRRFHDAGLRVAQLSPGLFRHTGQTQSRKAALGRRR